jgi:hypothetical protein
MCKSGRLPAVKAGWAAEVALNWRQGDDSRYRLRGWFCYGMVDYLFEFEGGGIFRLLASD